MIYLFNRVIVRWTGREHFPGCSVHALHSQVTWPWQLFWPNKWRAKISWSNISVWNVKKSHSFFVNPYPEDLVLVGWKIHVHNDVTTSLPPSHPPHLSSKPWLRRGTDLQFGDIKGRRQAPQGGWTLNVVNFVTFWRGSFFLWQPKNQTSWRTQQQQNLRKIEFFGETCFVFWFELIDGSLDLLFFGWAILVETHWKRMMVIIVFIVRTCKMHRFYHDVLGTNKNPFRLWKQDKAPFRVLISHVLRATTRDQWMEFFPSSSPQKLPIVESFILGKQKNKNSPAWKILEVIRALGAGFPLPLLSLVVTSVWLLCYNLGRNWSPNFWVFLVGLPPSHPPPRISLASSKGLRGCEVSQRLVGVNSDS